MKLPYKLGTWFTVPINSDSFVVGVVARMRPRGKIILAYFFGTIYHSPPTLEELESLNSEQSVCALRVGDLNLVNGEWKILGVGKNWNPDKWPMPIFTATDLLSKKLYKVQYSDNDPSILTDKTVIAVVDSSYQPDGMFGAGAAEKHLLRLLQLK